MTIKIRQATINDGPTIVPLIMEAIGEIANRLTGEEKSSAVETALLQLFEREDNRHSYLNSYVSVDEENDEVLGVLVIYSGQDAIQMDKNLSNWLEQKSAPTSRIDAEAYVDEFYIDTICVHPNARGKGIGSQLLIYAEEVARENQFTKLALNVELEKDKARKLYEKMGFVTTESWSIIDEPFHHMVKVLN